MLRLGARSWQRKTAQLLSWRSYASEASNEALQVTTLPNKVRVATEATPGHFSAVGVYVDAGSRYERPWIPGENGVSHLLDRMAFKSTRTRSASDMEQLIQAVGGNVMCSSSRDTIMYQSSVFNQDIGKVLDVFSDTIRHPILDATELGMQREAAAWEVSEIWSKPEMILPEIVHSVAYHGKHAWALALVPDREPRRDDHRQSACFYASMVPPRAYCSGGCWHAT